MSICVQVENVFVYNPGQADKAKIAKRKFEVLSLFEIPTYHIPFSIRWRREIF